MTFAPALYEKRQLTPHLAVDGARDRVTKDRGDQHRDVVRKRRHLAKQRTTDDIDVVVQDVVIDDELAIGGNGRRIPENRRHKKGEMQQVANDQFDVAEPRAEKRKEDEDPEGVGEQQDEAVDRQQSRLDDVNRLQEKPDEIEHDVMAEIDDLFHQGASGIQVVAQISRGDV